MSTIEEVRAAERKLQEVLDALNGPIPEISNCVGDELNKVSDEYARAIRELK
jgi:rRNA-processing protein FCF1